MSIPKVIHYVWVGGKPLPPFQKKCIESWSKYLPDYEIKEWNERNFDISANRYCKEAYESKKYAFVSDYIRIYVLYHYGGIYMDTDVEVIQPLSQEFLECEAFSGYETPGTIPTGIMGSIPGQRMFQAILQFYEKASFLREDGSCNIITNVQIITQIAKEHGFVPDNTKKSILGFTLYPQTYFCPLSHDSENACFSEDTYTIHHFSGTWCDRKTRFVVKWNHGMKQKSQRLLGKTGAALFYRVAYNVARLLDYLTEKSKD